MSEEKNEADYQRGWAAGNEAASDRMAGLEQSAARLALERAEFRRDAETLRAQLAAAQSVPDDDEIDAIASCLEDDAAHLRGEGFDEIPDNMEEAAALIRRRAANASADAPLVRRMMARLTELLDEDHFAEMDRMVTAAGIYPPAAQALVDEPALGDAPSDYSTNERHKWLAGWKACAARLAAHVPPAVQAVADDVVRDEGQLKLGGIYRVRRAGLPETEKVVRCWFSEGKRMINFGWPGWSEFTLLKGFDVFPAGLEVMEVRLPEWPAARQPSAPADHDDQTCGACGGIHDTLTPCDQVSAQQNREKGQ